MRAIRITEFGGPEVLTLADVPDPEPGPGQFLVDVSRAGVNYADTHQAENSYLSKTTLPHIPGAEIVGRAGDGRRVVAMVSGGGYAERAAADAALAFEGPDAGDDLTALAIVVPGATPGLLLPRTGPLEPGQNGVVHAAGRRVGSPAG